MQSDLADALAGEVAVTLKAALAPVFARLDVLEKTPTGVLLERIAVLEHRLTVSEQKSLSTPVITALEPVIDVDEIAKKAAALIPKPEDGKDGSPGQPGKDAEVDLDALAKKAAELIPKPENGKDADVDLDALALKAAELVTVPAPTIDMALLAKQAAALIPTPKNGKDADVDLEALAKKAAEFVPKPEKGEKGQDATVDEAMLTALVEQHVTKAVSALPRPENGTSVTVDDVAPLIAAQVQKAVAAVPPARDGVGVVDTLQDRDGHLRIVLSDGQTKDVGKISGRDGEPGKDIDPVAVKAMIVEEVAKIPIPKDGKDGAGFPEMDTSEDEFGRPTLVWPNGKSVRLPSIIDRGVWRQDNTYLKWDGVSYGGSFFIAQVEHPTSTPETNSKEWRLAVKRGRDGRGEKGAPGEPGAPGKDFTLPASATRGRY